MTCPESHCELVAKVGQESRFPDFQAGGHSSEPLTSTLTFPLPLHHLGPLADAQTHSTLQPLRAFAPAVPPAWHTLSGSTLPGQLFSRFQRKWKHLIWAALPESLCLSGLGSWVNFWYLLCGRIYVSASPFDSRLPESKDSFFSISVTLHPTQGLV